MLVIGDEPVHWAFEALGYHALSIDREHAADSGLLYRLGKQLQRVDPGRWKSEFRWSASPIARIECAWLGD